MMPWRYRLSRWLAARPLLRFAMSVLALLPACFVLWHALGFLLTAPAMVLGDGILSTWLPQLIDDIRIEGTDMIVVTTVGESSGRLLPAEAAGNQLAYPIDTRTLSYSIPFFAALFFATPSHPGAGAFAGGLITLWGLLLAGIVSTALKDLMLGLGDTFTNAGMVPPADAIALVYQFSALMVPPLAPVVIWAYCARDTATFRSLLIPGNAPAPPHT